MRKHKIQLVPGDSTSNRLLEERRDSWRYERRHERSPSGNGTDMVAIGNRPVRTLRSVRPAWFSFVVLSTASSLAADFPEPIDTQRDPLPLSTPAEALAAIKLPTGYRATVFAAEPLVRQPIAFTTDARGRVWVAENYTYAEAPLSLDTRQRDRIIVLEDTDHDGQADRRTVFWDRAVQLTSVEVGYGGVWALCPPWLLFLPDRNRDDVPDGEPVVMLDGFDVGPANRHNFANGLKWGPDGWLYGRNGISNDGLVGAPGTRAGQRLHVGPGIWRFHPVTKAVEMVATGTTNPWGHDWDEHGELFFINTVIGHLWHAVPGAHFRRMFGADADPHVYQLLEQTADHFHWDTREAWGEAKKGLSRTTDAAGGGHAHSGLMIYLGDNWPDRHRNDVFAVNLHGHRLNCDTLLRRGASYTATHGEDKVYFGDPWFRGIDLVYGPDGGVLVADWCDIGECHESDGVHRSSGRIYKITFGAVAPPQPASLDELDSLALVKLQLARNDWYVRQARRLLAERAAGGADQGAVHAALLAQYEQQTSVPLKLRALWALHVTGGAREDWLIEQLSQPDEHLRAWAVRLLAEPGSLAAPVLAALAQQAARDDSGLVQLYLASILQRLPPADRWPIAQALAQRDEFALDPVLPLMLWYGVEAAVPQHPAEAAALATSARIPLVRRFVARRIMQNLASDPAGVVPLVERLARVDEIDCLHDLLTGMNEALIGWRQVPPPANWANVHARLEKVEDAEVRRLVRQIAVVFGDGRAIDELKDVARSTSFDLVARRAAIRSLVDARADGLVPLLKGLLTEHDIAPDAVRGLAAFDDAGTPALLVASFARLYPPGREAAIATLTVRPLYAAALLEAIERGQIDRAHVSVAQVRQMQGYDEPRVVELLAKIWPDLRPIAADKSQRIAELRAALTPEALAAADRSAGRRVWEKTCAKCHTLFGEGAKIGPDLTGSQRTNLDYLLENVVDPSATLAPNYRATNIVLADGRVLTGIVLARTDTTWDVQTATERLTILAADVEEAQETRQSLMPEGQLDVLAREEVRDLVAYLLSSEQVPLAEASAVGAARNAAR